MINVVIKEKKMTVLSGRMHRSWETEPYMNSKQLTHFRNRILETKASLQRKLKETLDELREHKVRETEILDRSDANTFRDMKVAACQRYRTLIEQHDAALARMDDGTFGYCQLTGEEIGLERLELIPYARLSVDAQELLERGERLNRVA